MHYVKQLPAWSLALAAIFTLNTLVASSRPGDPTDDFSFMYAFAPASEAYNLMSQQKIEAVLADRLDMFPKSQVPRLAEHLMSLCRQYRFDPAFILSMIQVESGFRTKVVSYAGAVGLMQLMPPTADFVARRFNIRYTGERALKDPFTNLSLGVAYLSLLRDKYRHQSPYFHVAAYNIGPAKLDELRSRKSFKPTSTKEYYEKIKKGVPSLRFYQSDLSSTTPVAVKGRNRV